jgi:cytochrome c553
VSTHGHGLVAVAVLSWLVSLHGTLAAQTRPGQELPAGDGRDTVVAVCSDCHDVDVIAALIAIALFQENSYQ